MVFYGTVCVGPPGAGKSTCCNGLQQYLRLIGRETMVVNLDPANEYHGSNDDAGENGGNDDGEEEKSKMNSDDNDGDNDNNPSGTRNSHLPYDAILDASEDIINLSSVMESLDLGPNGGLIYCIEYIHHHTKTLIKMLKERIEAYMIEKDLGVPPYLLFDFPGQVELYTHNTSVQYILAALVKEMDIRLTAVHLVDAHSCADASKFISAALLSTTTMLRLELPAINVLSKVDLLKGYGDGSIPFNLDYFVECQELDRLLPFLEGLGEVQDDGLDEEVKWRIYEDEDYMKAREKTRSSRFYKRYHKLHKELCEVVDDYGLLSYIPLDINDGTSVGRLVARMDKCNGYVFTGRKKKSGKENDKEPSNVEDMFQCAMQMDHEWGYEQIADVQERFMHSFEEEVPELRKSSDQGTTKR
uniref:GPN-loop GTPase 2 n=1 Tax=Chaetoceros debilis TaxID=122233 RepID=A0A7S3PVG6_9STRA|mmetsp:Transcript_14040/g.20981  ORF Transcript_14040/g.20981 Transcript_14040/m.20981 type:complete len:414 (-) Transcript_14040:16-1257(-)